MSFQPYDLLEDKSISADHFWSLVTGDYHFYKMLRAYNTIGRVLHDSHVHEECLFDEGDLKRERLHIKDELYAMLRESPATEQ